MPRKALIASEDDVKKKLVKPWFDAWNAWHYAPIQNGLGEHGIHDRIGCVPIIVTQEMIGKRIGLCVSVEAKRPGRRGEKDRGMSVHQQQHLDAINKAGGIAICCDGVDDLQLLELRIRELQSG